MKQMKPLVLLFACSLASCGPSDSELRAELSTINSELMRLNIAAQQHQEQMNNANLDVLIGSFAAGYGATSGDFGLAGQGADAAYRGANQASSADYSLSQIRERQNALSRRRAEILRDLD